MPKPSAWHGLGCVQGDRVTVSLSIKSSSDLITGVSLRILPRSQGTRSWDQQSTSLLVTGSRRGRSGEDLDARPTSHEQLFLLKMDQSRPDITEYQFNKDQLHINYELVSPPRKGTHGPGGV